LYEKIIPAEVVAVKIVALPYGMNPAAV
jgi:hypothetical protein